MTRSWPPIFTNKILLENSYVICLYIICCSFCTATAQLYCQETMWSENLKDLQSDTLRKSLPTSAICLCMGMS